MNSLNVKKYRYQSKVNNQVIAEADYLLRLSASAGDIWDNFTNDYVNKMSDRLHLLEYIFNQEIFYNYGLIRVSELLADLESNPDYDTFYAENLTRGTLLTALCLNPHQFRHFKIGPFEWWIGDSTDDFIRVNLENWEDLIKLTNWKVENEKDCRS